MKTYFTILLIFLLIGNKIYCQEYKPSISELLINSTIRIECSGDTIIKGKKLRFTSIGTGFYFVFTIDTFQVPVIVTNRHVIKGCDTGIITFTEEVNKGPQYGSKLLDTISDFENEWIIHPSVDLAILPVNPIFIKLEQEQKKKPFFIPFDESLLPTKKLLDEITAIEEVLMIGYPQGVWDSINNLPIVRKGITATPVFIDYQGRKVFLLDIPIFPGSSGSPILLFNQGSYSSRTGGLFVGTRIFLLGINVQSVDYVAEGELILPPNNPKISTITQMPLNIALIIKSEELLVFKPILETLIQGKKN
jgi:hypothetical protein